MEAVNNSYRVFLWVSAGAIALMACVCFIRAILGPRSTDRIVSINAICTKVIILIAIVAYLLGEHSLLDVAIVYAMINFLAVVVLYKCYPITRRSDSEDGDHDSIDASFFMKADRGKQSDDS